MMTTITRRLDGIEADDDEGADVDVGDDASLVG